MSQPMNPYDPVEPPRQGMSGTSKVLLSFGIGCGVVLLLCCGVFGVVGYWGYSLAQRSFSDDAAVAERVSREIVTITIPDSFKPKFSIDMQIPFGQGAMQMVFYQGAANDSRLALLQFSSKALSDNPQARMQFDESMNRGRHNVEVLVEKSENFETTINKEPATFNIGEGTKQGSDEKYWRVTGNFTGNNGFAQFELIAPTEDLSKDDVLEILKSMK